MEEYVSHCSGKDENSLSKTSELKSTLSQSTDNTSVLQNIDNARITQNTDSPKDSNSVQDIQSNPSGETSSSSIFHAEKIPRDVILKMTQIVQSTYPIIARLSENNKILTEEQQNSVKNLINLRLKKAGISEEL